MSNDKLRVWKIKHPSDAMLSTCHLPFHIVDQQRESTHRNFRRTTNTAKKLSWLPNPSLILVLLLMYFAVLSCLWFAIAKHFEAIVGCFPSEISSETNCLGSSRDLSSLDQQYIHDQPDSIIFQVDVTLRNHHLTYPSVLYLTESDWEPDYNDLYFHSLGINNFRRTITDEKNESKYEREQEEKLGEINKSFDTYGTSDEPTYTQRCQRMEWKSLHFPVCNTVHEVVIDIEKGRYLGHGYYRDVWLIPNPIVGDTDLHVAVDFVLKRTRLPIDDDDDEHMPHPNSFNKIQKEALIMERLTSSPRIVSIYGHCGLSVLAETTPDEIVNFIVPESGHANKTLLEQLPHIQSMNNYTAIEKLDIALDMSKSIADLHGFSGGKILHGDIHPVQWLRSRVDGKLKLNDFNNAEILDLNRHPADVNDTFYCKAERGIWGGSFRSPEEFLGLPIDEQIDVFSMGNNIYTLITGLWPFYDMTDYTEIQEKILQLERPYIDPRYFSGNNDTFEERKLIEIMELMWEHDPKERPTIFEVVDLLTDLRQQM